MYHGGVSWLWWKCRWWIHKHHHNTYTIIIYIYIHTRMYIHIRIYDEGRGFWEGVLSWLTIKSHCAASSSLLYMYKVMSTRCVHGFIGIHFVYSLLLLLFFFVLVLAYLNQIEREVLRTYNLTCWWWDDLIPFRAIIYAHRVDRDLIHRSYDI